MSSQIEKEEKISEFLAGNAGQDFLQRQIQPQTIGQQYMKQLQGHVLQEGYESAITTLNEKRNEFQITLSKEDHIKNIVALLPPEVKQKLYDEIQKYQEIQSISYLTFKVEREEIGISRQPTIDFGEGPIRTEHFYQDFGLGNGPRNITKKIEDGREVEYFDLTYEQKELYLEIKEKMFEKGITDTLDVFHMTAGVIKISRDTNKSKEEALQIVNDLYDVYGITRSARYDSKILVTQWENTTIDRENNTYNLNIDPKQRQNVFFDVEYEYNGAAHSNHIEGSTKNSTNRKIEGLSGQVWIYGTNDSKNLFFQIEDFENEMKKNGTKYDIIISGHGNKDIIQFNKSKNESSVLNVQTLEENSDFFKKLKGVENIIIMACSTHSNENRYNNVAKKLHELTGARVYAAESSVFNIEYRRGDPPFLFDYGKRFEKGISTNYHGLQIYEKNEKGDSYLTGYVLKNYTNRTERGKNLKYEYRNKID